MHSIGFQKPCCSVLTCSSPPASLDQHSVLVQAWSAAQRYLAQSQAVQVIQLMSDETHHQVNQNQHNTHNHHQYVIHGTCWLQITYKYKEPIDDC